jgi:Family of unknown function (DUF6353)
MNSLYKYIPKGISSTLGRTILKTSKHSPHLLFAGGVVGVVATAVMASRATLKVDEALNEHRKDLELAKHMIDREEVAYSKEDYQKDVVTIYAKMVVDVSKLYGPTVIVGFLSIAALTKSHTMLTRRNAALTAAYAALEKGFAEYRKRVVQEYGEETDRRLRHSTDWETVKTIDPSGKEIEVQTRRNPNDYSIYARFFDQTNRHFNPEPGYNSMFLRARQNWANDLLRARGHLFLNEVYDMIGAERTKAGSVVGWVISGTGDNFVDFGIFDADHEMARAFVNGYEDSILLDFNVDGVIYDKI